MCRNKKGFTLIEIIISMAILSIVMIAIYSFFLTNYKSLNRVSLEAEIQSQAQVALDKVTIIAMESSKVDINTEGIDRKINKSTEYVRLSKDAAIEYNFTVEDNKLILSTIDNGIEKETTQLSDCVEYLICKEISIGVSGTKVIGVEIEIAFEKGIKDGIDKVVKNEIYFRN